MNQTIYFSRISILLLLIAAVAVAISSDCATASADTLQGVSALRATYLRNIAAMEKNSFGIPLSVVSFEQHDRVHVDVYGIVAHPFSTVADVLTQPDNWCDIISLYPNVKASTYRNDPGTTLLTMYLGQKIYQAPEDARRVDFHFKSVAQQRYLDIVLNAEDGPYGTTDHMIRVGAMPIDGGRTFIHVSYAYSDSVALRLASKVYFATLGRRKVGFTVIAEDGKGNPVYIRGPRGAVERNAVRCYFAIQSFINTSHLPKERRFSMRANQWYDLTTRYKEQLLDLEKQDYLSFKTAERSNQLLLQQSLDTAHQ